MIAAMLIVAISFIVGITTINTLTFELTIAAEHSATSTAQSLRTLLTDGKTSTAIAAKRTSTEVKYLVTLEMSNNSLEKQVRGVITANDIQQVKNTAQLATIKSLESQVSGIISANNSQQRLNTAQLAEIKSFEKILQANQEIIIAYQKSHP